VVGERQVTPFLFDAGDSFNCDFKKTDTWQITSYKLRSKDLLLPSKTVKLYCGTATYGFTHIRARHQWGTKAHPNSWEKLRASATAALGKTAPYSWDDFMDNAIKDTLFTTSPRPSALPNSMGCWSAPFHIWKGSRIYSSWYANTIISRSGHHIVTAYLSDPGKTSDCDGNT
jgi:hypothetical protein